VIAIFYVGMEGYLNLRAAPLGSYEIDVTAMRWSWTFTHKNGCTQVGELYVPVGRPVKLNMHSEDVLHSLYIPAFRVKQDVVPGRYTYLWFEATKPGDYDLFCTEYCGKDHSQMTARVIAMPEDEFQAKLQECADFIDKPEYAGDNLFKAGPRLYNRCASCHTLDGKSSTGPSWKETHSLWGKERVLTDGSKVTVDENYIKESILTPQKHIVMNFTGAMPTFKGQLKEREVEAMVQFIRRLNEFDEKGNYLGGVK
jgi:cytochrome c oxidase subunit II